MLTHFTVSRQLPTSLALVTPNAGNAHRVRLQVRSQKALFGHPSFFITNATQSIMSTWILLTGILGINTFRKIRNVSAEEEKKKVQLLAS